MKKRRKMFFLSSCHERGTKKKDIGVFPSRYTKLIPFLSLKELLSGSNIKRDKF